VRQAAARRRTSFSRSSSRIRFVAPRSSAFSAAVVPGLRPSSTSAERTQYEERTPRCRSRSDLLDRLPRPTVTGDVHHIVLQLPEDDVPARPRAGRRVIPSR
jgi:hypothetical protein